MPSKRPPLPSENPPSPSSSDEDDEEEIEVSQEEEQQPTTKPRSKKPFSNSILTQDDEEEEDSDEYESDSDVLTQNPHTSPALDIKPISSKPMADLPKSKKPTSSTESPAPASASVKRKSKSETEEKDSRKDKKKKKKVSDLPVEENETEKKKSGDDDHKKLLFQRLWAEQDEVTILKGMINFKKKGKDPSAQVGQFFDSIKDSLETADVNKGQLHSKIRRLKSKYQNAAKKAKPGEDPNISKPHDLKVYQLAKKVWGKEGGKEEESDVKSVGIDVASVDEKKSKSKRSSEVVSMESPSPKVTVAALPNNSSPTVAPKVENDSATSSEYIYLNESFLSKNSSVFPVPPPGLGEIVMKKGWDVIGSEHAKELDQRWKKVMIAETKAYLERINLVREQTQMMLDALESSNH